MATNRRNNELVDGKFASIVMIDGKFYSPKIGQTVEAAKTVLIDRLRSFCGKGDSNGLPYQAGNISSPLYMTWANPEANNKVGLIISHNVDKAGRKIYTISGDYAHLKAILDVHGQTPLANIANGLWQRLQAIRFVPVEGETYNAFVTLTLDQLHKIKPVTTPIVTAAMKDDPEPVNPKTGKVDSRTKAHKEWQTRQAVRAAQNLGITTTVKETLHRPDMLNSTPVILPSQKAAGLKAQIAPLPAPTTSKTSGLSKKDAFGDWTVLHNEELIDSNITFAVWWEANKALYS
jgi:hypothetical protein